MALLTLSITVSDLTPNVGVWWYFFTEMFDHFRNFFVGVFQVSSLHSAILALTVSYMLSSTLLPSVFVSGMTEFTDDTDLQT
jgi:hypothetical protein